MAGAVQVTEAVTVAGTVTAAGTVGPGLWWARAGTESGMGQPPENREDGIEQRQCRCDGGLVHVAPSHRDGQMGTHFPGGAGSDPVVMKSILARASSPFGDVARHGGASAFELQGQIPVVKANTLDRRPERVNHLQSHFVDLEAFHQDLLCRGLTQAAVRV